MQQEGRSFEAREVKHEATGSEASLSLDLAAAYPEFETIPIDDCMRQSWGSALHRVVLTSKKQDLADAFTIRIETP